MRKMKKKKKKKTRRRKNPTDCKIATPGKLTSVTKNQSPEDVASASTVEFQTTTGLS